MQITAAALAEYRQTLMEILGRLAHRLQTPGFGVNHDDALPFDQAPTETQHLSDAEVYFQERQYREFYRKSRIADDDLSTAFAACPHLNAEAAIAGTTREAIYKIALLHDLPPLTDSQLHWQNQEMQAFAKLQDDVPEPARREFLAGGKEPEAVERLWRGLLYKLELTQSGLEPDSPLNLDANIPYPPAVNQEQHALTRKQAEREFEQLLDDLGAGISLRGLVLALSGSDSLDYVCPQLLRICASALDKGIAYWHLPECRERGFYPAWRAALPYDANLFLQQLPDWQEIVAELPEQALDAISLQLLRLGIPEQRWSGYLQCLAAELPGCSGIISRNAANPEHGSGVALADYLAIRLVLDRLWLNQICHELWQVEAKLGALKTYFHKNLSEFLVRRQLYQGQLPEHLASLAEALIIRAGSERQCRGDWQQLADLLSSFQAGRPKDGFDQPSAADSAWRLFRLCQHLGFNANKIEPLQKTDLLAMLKVVDEFDAVERGNVWLYALERHYREGLFRALEDNRPAGHKTRDDRPSAQVIERNQLLIARPEPFGYAQESLVEGLIQNFPNWPRQWVNGADMFWHWPLRLGLARSFLATLVLAPLGLLVLLGKSLWPRGQQRFQTWLLTLIPPNSADLNNDGLQKTALDDAEPTDRLADFSQIPRSAHANPVALIIGRRALAESLPFAHPVCLLSYDPSQDPDGKVLEKILQTEALRIIRLNLDNYFAAVNKSYDDSATYNRVGLFAVMPGTDSDFRAGLPAQTHEALRLTIVVESKPAVLAAIIDRHERLRELFAGRWAYLSVIDPDNGDISVFEPSQGFQR